MPPDDLTKHIAETYPGVPIGGTGEPRINTMRQTGNVYLDANNQVRVAGSGVIVVQPVFDSIVAATVTKKSTIYRGDRGKDGRNS